MTDHLYEILGNSSPGKQMMFSTQDKHFDGVDNSGQCKKQKKRMAPMKTTQWILSAAVMAMTALSLVPNSFSQATSTQATSAPPATTETQDTNIDAYIALLRSNVSTAKTAVLTQTMQLTDAQNTKFWPLYREYDVKLQALNDEKIAGIKDYANSYDTMTDAKANQLATLVLNLEEQRNQLKKTYYDKMRKQLGGVMAARWLQVENQLLMVIDLQIASSLPIVTAGSPSN